MVAGEEELLGRQAPHSLEAEQSVLGAMLIDSRCVADVIGLLKPEDFYLQQNREIYETIYAMFNFSQVIDPVTVLDKMQERGVWQDHSIEYIKQLMEITPTSANAVRYASIVRDKALLRSLATAASEISETVYEGVGTPAEILESAEKKIYALRKGERGESLEPISLVLHKVFDRLTELAQSDSDIPGLSTGLIDLDRKINGLNRSDLLLIAARPAMGKTSFALNIALNVAKKYGQTVAFFSLEMSREQLAMRLLAGESFVDSQKMATGKLSEEEWTKLALASAALSQTDIRVDDNPSITVAEMNAKCRRLDNLGLVLVDYLQLMTGSGSPAPLSRMQMRCCSCTGTTTTMKIPRKRTWPNVLFPKTATARPVRSSSSGSPSTPPLPIGSGSMLNEAVERAPGYCRLPAIPLADICL